MPRLSRYMGKSPSLIISGTLLAALVLTAVFAPMMGTSDPAAIAPTLRNKGVSAAFWFGTDLLGRDVYSRVIYGARVSLVTGFSVALLATSIGLVIGLVAGFIRWMDAVVMRIIDGIMAIPTILLAIAMISITGPSLTNVILAVTIAEIPRVVRLVRGVVLSLREQPYVEAAIAAGASTPRIIIKHIFPNTLAPLIVQATYICGVAILSEASLSFIGAGVPPTTPSWGNVMSEGRSLWQLVPHLIAFPALFLSLTILSINMLGDSLRDHLDPRMNKIGH